MPTEVKIAPVSCLGAVFIGSVTNEVKLSINSLLASTLAPAQIIIIVDGPISDSLHKLLCTYKEINIIKIITFPVNQGLGIALNKGLQYCSHDIVIRFDTDDINDSSRIVRLYEYMLANPAVDLVGSYVSEFVPIDISMAKSRIKRTPLDHDNICRALLYKNAFNHPSVAFRKTAVIEVGSYEDIPYFEDYYLWMKMRAANKVMANIPFPLVFMRRTSNLSRRYGFQYAARELNFALRVLENKLAGPIFIITITMRIILHCLPRKMQQLQNYLPWRGKSFLTNNPENVLING